jgi:hypothetical protein
MNLEILFTARERLAFTKATFELLIRNTNWNAVTRMVVIDDESGKESKFWLSEKVVELNRSGNYPEIEMWHTKLHSPPALMNHFIERTACDVFAKIDNDIALPPFWLENMLSVWTSQEIELLGMEAGQTKMAGRDGVLLDGAFGFEECTHIGGVGLMNAERFRQLPPIPVRGYFGWTEHQQLYRWIRGWITPDIPCPQLDRIPEEPWLSLTAYYKQRGWNRDWPPYEKISAPYWSWIPHDIIELVGPVREGIA